MTTLEQSKPADEARDSVLRSGSVSSCNDLLGFPPVLDACCGTRMMWFDKQDKRTIYIDKRR